MEVVRNNYDLRLSIALRFFEDNIQKTGIFVRNPDESGRKRLSEVFAFWRSDRFPQESLQELQSGLRDEGDPEYVPEEKALHS